MRKRILIISLITTLLGIIFFTLAFTSSYYNAVIDQAKSVLPVYYNMYDEEYSFDDDGAKALSEKLGGARVTFITAEGEVAGDSSGEENLPNHSDREEIAEAMESGEGFAIRKSQTLGENMAYYCRQTESGDLVRIAISTQSEWAFLLLSLSSVITYILLDIVACLLFTYFATYFMLRPVEELTTKATLGGEVSTGYPELKTICDVLNERNRSINSQMRELENERLMVQKAQDSKNEFIANVTHEMNTPLTSIKGYAELLCSGQLSEELRQTAYSTISSQTERLTNLIACIINYNEIDSDDLPPYELDFTKIVRETLAVVRPEADKRGIELVDCTENNITVISRHEMMSELAGNLIRNAIRYNKDGGKVIVELNFKHFSVEDTGIGIAPENMDKVFSRFFTVDKSHSGKNGGFGLGLAVCKKICQRQGWHISVESRLGEGSKFTVDFSLN